MIQYRQRQNTNLKETKANLEERITHAKEKYNRKPLDIKKVALYTKKHTLC